MFSFISTLKIGGKGANLTIIFVLKVIETTN